MNDWKWAITLATCCGIVLTIAASASADFVGVTTVIKDDPDTEFWCTQGNGGFVPGPLTVCNVLAIFDNPDDVLLSVGLADLQVYNGTNPDVFYQHPLDAGTTAPSCSSIEFVSPDLICDSFVTIGWKCVPDPTFENPTPDATALDGSWNGFTFEFTGRILGGWWNSNPPNGQGDAGTWPDLQVLFLQSSVAQGLSLSGDIALFWVETYLEGDVVAELDVSIECAAVCPDDYPCDDGDACTENDQCIDGVCTGVPINCLDGNPCTDDECDPDTGCTHTPNNDPCDDGDACTYNDMCGEDGCVHGIPVDCSDLDDQCNYGMCNPDMGTCEQVPVPDGTPADDGNLCTQGDMCVDGAPSGTPVQCPEGQVCEPASGECVESEDPCECVNGRVTLCHIPPGNPDNARTITIGCAARDRHLAHGDTCGPCEDAAARNEAKEKSAKSDNVDRRNG